MLNQESDLLPQIDILSFEPLLEHLDLIETFSELLLHLLAFGDVKRQAHDAIRLSGRFQIALSTGDNPSDASIREHDPVIAEKISPDRSACCTSWLNPVPILGMDHPEVTFIGNLFIRGKMKQLPALWRNPDLFRVDYP